MFKKIEKKEDIDQKASEAIAMRDMLQSGNGSVSALHTEEVLRDRIGHNMKAFLLAYAMHAGRKARPSTLKQQWHALKGAGSETLKIISSIQRRRAFLLLERQGYLYRSVSMVEGKRMVAFKFTEKGLSLQERYADEAMLESLSKQGISESKCDDKTHIVSWDIPEALRQKRALFRYFAKSLGYRLLHKSFFVGEINASRFLARAAELLGIEKFIHCGVYSPTVYQGMLVS